MNIIDKLELGIIYEGDTIINHRSLIKVILNPFLRLFGFNIATKYDTEKNILLNPVLISCKKIKNIKFQYDNKNFYKVEKKRILI